MSDLVSDAEAVRNRLEAATIEKLCAEREAEAAKVARKAALARLQKADDEWHEAAMADQQFKATGFLPQPMLPVPDVSQEQQAAANAIAGDPASRLASDPAEPELFG